MNAEDREPQTNGRLAIRLPEAMYVIVDKIICLLF